jgi:hypothetical protein
VVVVVARVVLVGSSDVADPPLWPGAGRGAGTVGATLVDGAGDSPVEAGVVERGPVAAGAGSPRLGIGTAVVAGAEEGGAAVVGGATVVAGAAVVAGVLVVAAGGGGIGGGGVVGGGVGAAVEPTAAAGAPGAPAAKPSGVLATGRSCTVSPAKIRFGFPERMVERLASTTAHQ